jgi:cobalt-zinc-cadmium efflux system protein
VPDAHVHDHFHHGREADQSALKIALALILAFMVAEVVAGVLASSLALLSDAAHMLTDAAALAISLAAARLATKPARGAMTYGLGRVEILSAQANGVTLLVLGGVIVYEAIARLVSPPDVRGGLVLIVALVGIVVNLAAVAVLGRGAGERSLNVEGSYRHILTDLYGFIATAVAAIVILATGFSRADPIASLLIAALIIPRTWRLLHQAGDVLLEATPKDVDLDEVRRHMLATDRVIDVHDLHAWTITSGVNVLSAHVVVDSEALGGQVLDHLGGCLADHFDIEHSTFQIEPPGHRDHEPILHR